MNKKPTEEKDETEDKDEVKFDTVFTHISFFRLDTGFGDICKLCRPS